MSEDTTRMSSNVVALMGPTGTGKSTFIKLLSNDDKIRIGHSIESETIDVSTTSYSEAGRVVTLVDTPGFDDSREGVADTDILEKIAKALQEGEGLKLDGIIYLHRISDPRVGGTIKKNIRMFRELCGDENLHRVRIVTTNWDRVTEKEGNDREAALRNSVFKPFIDAKAKMLRHDKEISSARSIMSTVLNGEPPVMLKIQKELNEGKTLRETSAGAVIIEEMIEMEKKHNKEMEAVRKEMEEATRENNEELRNELAVERRKLEGFKARAEADKRKLERTRMASQARPSLPADKAIPEPASSTQSSVHSQQKPSLRDGRPSQDHTKETIKLAGHSHQREELKAMSENNEELKAELKTPAEADKLASWQARSSRPSADKTVIPEPPLASSTQSGVHSQTPPPYLVVLNSAPDGLSVERDERALLADNSTAEPGFLYELADKIVDAGPELKRVNWVPNPIRDYCEDLELKKWNTSPAFGH